MKKARRVPRKIGEDEDGDAEVPVPDDVEDTDTPTIVVKRPTFSSRIKKSSSSSHFNRTSFHDDDNEDDANGENKVVKPTKKNSSIHRHAAQQNSSRYRIATDRLPDRLSDTEERPSYSSSYLNELRNSTPSGPVKTQGSTSPPSLDDLDIASKFGSAAPTTTLIASTSTTRIPSEAEIREKKERRRRLAQEANAEEYISLNDRSEASSEDQDDENPRSQSLIISAEEVNIPSKYGESRLVREDEDIAEGFDDFVEDAGRVTLSRSARRDQERERRRQIEKQIREASDGGHSSDDAEEESSHKQNGISNGDYDDGEDEDAEQRHAYDASQARAGMYAMGGRSRHAAQMDREAQQQRLLQPPKLRPIPDLRVLAAQYTQAVKEKELAKANAERRLEQLRLERQEIESDESRIKLLLKEAGEKLEKLTAGESTLAAAAGQNTALPVGSLGDQANVVFTSNSSTLPQSSASPPPKTHVPSWPLPRGNNDGSSSDDDVNEEGDRGSQADMQDAFAQQRRGFAGMSGRPAHKDNDDDEDDYY